MLTFLEFFCALTEIVYANTIVLSISVKNGSYNILPLSTSTSFEPTRTVYVHGCRRLLNGDTLGTRISTKNRNPTTFPF